MDEMDNEQAFTLLRKYNSGECTDAEKALVEESFMAFSDQNVEISLQKLQALKHQIARDLPKPLTKTRYVKISMAITSAAAVIAFVLYLVAPKTDMQVKDSMSIAERILPKGNVAQITFSSGKSIELDKHKNEINVNGISLTYNDGSKVTNNETSSFQTITTPNGGEYKIVLSDGTKVWLNAATVLQYPTSFRERTERRVKLVSGEAYFEVAKDRNHPFIVESKNQDLTVLGTHFNVNTYDKVVKTTLLEGSVKLKSSNNSSTMILKPGEQSAADGMKFKVGDADIQLNTAWVNGKIKFRDASLESILKEAERWYNIKVEYGRRTPEKHLTGGISRKSSLATLLKLLQLSGINFSLSEKQGIKTLTIKS